MTQPTPLILAADIGGTNTRVALLDGTVLRSGSLQRFENAKVGSLEDILQRYMKAQSATPDAIGLALAGPVTSNIGQLTNLNWTISTKAASAVCNGAKAFLLNDLQAQGHALPFIEQANIIPVLTAPKSETTAAPALVIGIGTGMNIAPVHHVQNQTLVAASEAGHTDFTPYTPALQALGDALQQRLGHVALEDVLSGRGIERAYRHVTDLQAQAHEIMALCAQGDASALRAAGLLIQTLGHFAGDAALSHLPRGGIFLVGGVARALQPYMLELGFAEAFADKGRFSDFMAQFPISVVHDDYAALSGVASHVIEQLH